MPAFRMVIELAGMADIDLLDEGQSDPEDDSVELIIKRDGVVARETTDFDTAHEVLEKLEQAGVTNHEALKDYEYSGKHS